MLKPEQIPDKAMNALLLAMRIRKGWKEALAAAINAWPGMEQDRRVRVRNDGTLGLDLSPRIILPLPQEKTDE